MGIIDVIQIQIDSMVYTTSTLHDSEEHAKETFERKLSFDDHFLHHM